MKREWLEEAWLEGQQHVKMFGSLRGFEETEHGVVGMIVVVKSLLAQSRTGL